MVDRCRNEARFENNENIGSYQDITFEIVGKTELGKESIRFDAKIHYYEKGQGVPLLLIHGIGQSLYTWRHNINCFADNGYRVIAIDLAGAGYSSNPHIYYTVEENALIIKAFLDAMHIDSINIAAFSTGCLTAVCLAALHPKKVGRLVLASPGGPNENYPLLVKALTTWVGHTVFKHYFTQTCMHKILSQLYFDATLVKNDVVEGYYRPFLDKETRESLVIGLNHFDDEYTRSLLKSVMNETLIIAGSEDRVHAEDMINAYKRIMPDTKFVGIRNCGHVVHEEKPAKFNNAVLAFLKGSQKDHYTSQLINQKYLL